MRHYVITNITNQVTGNVASEVANRVSDIGIERVNDKFIADLPALEEH